MHTLLQYKVHMCTRAQGSSLNSCGVSGVTSRWSPPSKTSMSLCTKTSSERLRFLLHTFFSGLTAWRREPSTIQRVTHLGCHWVTTRVLGGVLSRRGHGFPKPGGVCSKRVRGIRWRRRQTQAGQLLLCAGTHLLIPTVPAPPPPPTMNSPHLIQ